MQQFSCREIIISIVVYFTLESVTLQITIDMYFKG